MIPIFFERLKLSDHFWNFINTSKKFSDTFRVEKAENFQGWTVNKEKFIGTLKRIKKTFCSSKNCMGKFFASPGKVQKLVDSKIFCRFGK